MADPIKLAYADVTDLSSALNRLARSFAIDEAAAKGLSAQMADLRKNFQQYLDAAKTGAAEQQKFYALQAQFRSAQQFGRELKAQEAGAKLLGFALSDTAGKIQMVGQAFSKSLGTVKGWAAEITGATLTLRELSKTLVDYNRDVYQAGIISGQFGHSIQLNEDSFKKLQSSTTFSRQGFAALNQSFKNLYLGIPPTTEAVLKFAQAMSGRLGYSQEVIIEKTKVLLGLQQKLPMVFEAIEAAQHAYSRSASEGAAAASTLMMALKAIGASRAEIQTALAAATPQSAAIKMFGEMERRQAKLKQAQQDTVLHLAQSLEPVMAKIAQITQRVLEMFEKLPPSVVAWGAGIATAGAALASVVGTVATLAAGARGIRFAVKFLPKLIRQEGGPIPHFAPGGVIPGGSYVINERMSEKHAGVLNTLGATKVTGGVPHQDSVMAMSSGGAVLLTPGERILSPSYAKIGEALNKGRLKGFADGGQTDEIATDEQIDRYGRYAGAGIFGLQAAKAARMGVRASRIGGYGAYGAGAALRFGAKTSVIGGAVEGGFAGWDEWKAREGESSGRRATATGIKALGAGGGAAAGILAGAGAGAAIGSIVPGFGTIAGLVIGGVLSYVGAKYGGQWSDALMKQVGLGRQSVSDKYRNLAGKNQTFGWSKESIDNLQEGNRQLAESLKYHTEDKKIQDIIKNDTDDEITKRQKLLDLVNEIKDGDEKRKAVLSALRTGVLSINDLNKVGIKDEKEINKLLKDAVGIEGNRLQKELSILSALEKQTETFRLYLRLSKEAAEGYPRAIAQQAERGILGRSAVPGGQIGIAAQQDAMRNADRLRQFSYMRSRVAMGQGGAMAEGISKQYDAAQGEWDKIEVEQKRRALLVQGKESEINAAQAQDLKFAPNDAAKDVARKKIAKLEAEKEQLQKDMKSDAERQSAIKEKQDVSVSSLASLASGVGTSEMEKQMERQLDAIKRQEEEVRRLQVAMSNLKPGDNEGFEKMNRELTLASTTLVSLRGTAAELSTNMAAAEQQAADYADQVVKAAEAPTAERLVYQEKSVEMNRKMMELAERNNLGLAKSYEYTRKTVIAMERQIQLLKHRTSDYDVKIVDAGRKAGLNQAEINAGMQDMEGFYQRILSDDKMDVGNKKAVLDLIQARQKTQQDILEISTQEAEITKQIREGYLSAMSEMIAGAGDFSGLIPTQTSAVTAMIVAGAPSTYKYGGVGGNQGRGGPTMRYTIAGPQGFGGETGLEKATSVNSGYDFNGPLVRNQQSDYLTAVAGRSAAGMGGLDAWSDKVNKSTSATELQTEEVRKSASIFSGLNQSLGDIVGRGQFRKGWVGGGPQDEGMTGDRYTGGVPSNWAGGNAPTGSRTQRFWSSTGGGRGIGGTEGQTHIPGVGWMSTQTAIDLGYTTEEGSRIAGYALGGSVQSGSYVVRASRAHNIPGGQLVTGGTPGRDSQLRRVTGMARGGIAVQPGEKIFGPKDAGRAALANAGWKFREFGGDALETAQRSTGVGVSQGGGRFLGSYLEGVAQRAMAKVDSTGLKNILSEVLGDPREAMRRNIVKSLQIKFAKSFAEHQNVAASQAESILNPAAAQYRNLVGGVRNTYTQRMIERAERSSELMSRDFGVVAKAPVAATAAGESGFLNRLGGIHLGEVSRFLADEAKGFGSNTLKKYGVGQVAENTSWLSSVPLRNLPRYGLNQLSQVGAYLTPSNLRSIAFKTAKEGLAEGLWNVGLNFAAEKSANLMTQSDSSVVRSAGKGLSWLSGGGGKTQWGEEEYVGGALQPLIAAGVALQRTKNPTTAVIAAGVAAANTIHNQKKELYKTWDRVGSASDDTAIKESSSVWNWLGWKKNQGTYSTSVDSAENAKIAAANRLIEKSAKEQGIDKDELTRRLKKDYKFKVTPESSWYDQLLDRYEKNHDLKTDEQKAIDKNIADGRAYVPKSTASMNAAETQAYFDQAAMKNFNRKIKADSTGILDPYTGVPMLRSDLNKSVYGTSAPAGQGTGVYTGGAEVTKSQLNPDYVHAQKGRGTGILVYDNEMQKYIEQERTLEPEKPKPVNMILPAQQLPDPMAGLMFNTAPVIQPMKYGGGINLSPSMLMGGSASEMTHVVKLDLTDRAHGMFQELPGPQRDTSGMNRGNQSGTVL